MNSQNLQVVSTTAISARQKQPHSLQIDLSKPPPPKLQQLPPQQSRLSPYSKEQPKNKTDKEYDRFLHDRVIEVQSPQLIKEGLLMSYKLYRVRTKKNDSEGYDTSVSRRFNDFQFLHHSIIDEYGGYVLPRLPQKNFLANLNLQTREFADVRTKELQKYLMKLLQHSKIRYSQQLRHFLFDEQFDFSFNKGEFSEQSVALEGLKTITSSVYDITKSVYTRFVGKKEQKCEFSKIREQQTELKLFEREVEDLLKVTKDIAAIISTSAEEFTLVHELSILSGKPHLNSIASEQQFVLSFQQLTAEFEEICSFIQNCKDAIDRTKILRAELEQLEEQLAVMEFKQRENPRKRELDILRSKIQKGSTKCQKWVSSLRKELSVYTSEGKTLMQHFVRRFTQLKGEIYAEGQAQF